MSEDWSNKSCGDIQLRLIEDIFDSIWHSAREKIDDLQGLKDGIARMIRELRQEEKMKIKVITNAWIDRKTGELFELSSYTDEKGWVVQAISRVVASKFICQLLSELPDETEELKKNIRKLEEDIDLLKDVVANPRGLL